MDPPLSARGRAQAGDLAARLAGRQLSGFYCSDLLRARQTAEIIAEAVDLQPVLEPGLREIMLGAWEGKSREELRREYPEEWASWVREPSWDLIPGGEGAQPFEQRVGRVLREILNRHPAGDVLCVTHGGVIQVALLSVVGRRSHGQFPFLIDNASLTVIQWAGTQAVITAVNDTCHLA
jgi:broad specificity phosphatase PhoE